MNKELEAEAKEKARQFAESVRKLIGENSEYTTRDVLKFAEEDFERGYIAGASRIGNQTEEIEKMKAEIKELKFSLSVMVEDRDNYQHIWLEEEKVNARLNAELSVLKDSTPESQKEEIKRLIEENENYSETWDNAVMEWKRVKDENELLKSKLEALGTQINIEGLREEFHNWYMAYPNIQRQSLNIIFDWFIEHLKDCSTTELKPKIQQMTLDELKEEERIVSSEIEFLRDREGKVGTEVFYRTHPDCKRS